MPARWPPLLYIGFAHACSRRAFVVAALRPAEIAGFYYHPRLIALVHLVTLGWVSSSILGALYIVGPLTFRIMLPGSWRDVVAFAAWAIAVTGVAAHFWLETLVGVAWAGTLALLAMAFVVGRVLRRLPAAPVPIEARLPVMCAIVNMLGAVLLGSGHAGTRLSVLAVSKLDAVVAHAHLPPRVGVMMVMGEGYRIRRCASGRAPGWRGRSRPPCSPRAAFGCSSRAAPPLAERFGRGRDRYAPHLVVERRYLDAGHPRPRRPRSRAPILASHSASAWPGRGVPVIASGSPSRASAATLAGVHAYGVVALAVPAHLVGVAARLLPLTRDVGFTTARTRTAPRHPRCALAAGAVGQLGGGRPAPMRGSPRRGPHRWSPWRGALAVSRRPGRREPGLGSAAVVERGGRRVSLEALGSWIAKDSTNQPPWRVHRIMWPHLRRVSSSRRRPASWGAAMGPHLLFDAWASSNGLVPFKLTTVS